MEEVLNATTVRNNFSEFIDKVVREKPQAVKRNRDVFISISHEQALEMLKGYTIAIEYEQEEDGSYVGSLIPFTDMVVHGKDFDEMLEDAAIQLYEYAQDYYSNFTRYYNAPNRRSHLPYILAILLQDGIEGVKSLIRG